MGSILSSLKCQRKTAIVCVCLSVHHCPKGVFKNSVSVGRSKRLLSRRMCFVLGEGRGKPVHTAGLSYTLDRIQWNFSCLGTLWTTYSGTLQSQLHRDCFSTLKMRYTLHGVQWNTSSQVHRDCFSVLKVRYTLHGVHWNTLSVRHSLGCTATLGHFV
jgi:hypothetical protein